MYKKIAFFLIAFVLILLLGFSFFLEFNSQKVDDIPLNLAIPTPFQSTSTQTPPLEGGGREPASFLESERELLKNTPVLQGLPSEDLPFFSIGYIDETHLVLYAKTENKTRDYEEAIKWLEQKGITTQNISFDYK